MVIYQTSVALYVCLLLAGYGKIDETNGLDMIPSFSVLLSNSLFLSNTFFFLAVYLYCHRMMNLFFP